MLTGYIIEILSGPTWRRGNVVAWTRDEAERLAAARLEARHVQAVRIIPFAADEASAGIVSKVPLADLPGGAA